MIKRKYIRSLLLETTFIHELPPSVAGDLDLKNINRTIQTTTDPALKKVLINIRKLGIEIDSIQMKTRELFKHVEYLENREIPKEKRSGNADRVEKAENLLQSKRSELNLLNSREEELRRLFETEIRKIMYSNRSKYRIDVKKMYQNTYETQVISIDSAALKKMINSTKDGNLHSLLKSLNENNEIVESIKSCLAESFSDRGLEAVNYMEQKQIMDAIPIWKIFKKMKERTFLKTIEERYLFSKYDSFTASSIYYKSASKIKEIASIIVNNYPEVYEKIFVISHRPGFELSNLVS